MEKKNINIGVVRTCTILLLTVFTIGRKYGHEQNATDLIDNLKQQPCACCLNFNDVSEVAKVIDDTKTELKIAKTDLEIAKTDLEKAKTDLEKAKTDLEKANKNLVGEKNNLQDHNVQLLNQNKDLEIRTNNLELEKNKINELLEQQNSKCNELNKNLGELRENFTKINDENKKQGKRLTLVQNVFKKVKKEKDDLAEILRNIKTNANTEECVKFYNNNFAEKKAKIGLLLEQEEVDEKKYTFYIPFKFKEDYQRDIFITFAEKPGYYKQKKTLYGILQSFFERYAVGKFKEKKIIDVAILKEIYFYLKFQYEGEEKKVITGDDGVKLPYDCFYSIEGNDNLTTTHGHMAGGTLYEIVKNKVQLDYSQLIELVKIDEYLEIKKKLDDDKDLFLLELDFKDPECIALLESVGKGNYGVVKKGLTFENGKLVTKAIKFTCYNEKFENSKEENILKEIRAGKIINEIGVGNKIAFVKDYMKISEFIKRYDEKRIPLGEETEDGDLTNAVYTTFLNEALNILPSGKENVKKDFQNNVFSSDGKIGKDLYIMFMDLVSGSDLFLNKEKNIDINILGKMLFDVLISLYISGVALKDIKPKNIILDEKEKDFSIIDVQTLGQVGRKLTDSFGTPELWPFFKTLNLNLESENEIKNNEIKDNDKKDNLYDRFCYSIDDNFVDIYAACMTMYFAKFNTYTAAGLLTLLLKWIILEKDKNKDIKIKKLVTKDKIEFLKKYKENYTNYITDIKNNEKIEDLDENKKLIKSFFEEIDDKNLNDNQKKDLAKLLKQVIYNENESKIFYLLDEIREKIGKKDEIEDLSNDDFNNIITFYKQCVKNDFDNFAELSGDKCKYADVIKYVLCYGSCLNYNGESKEEMKVDDILPKLALKKEIESKDKEFFDTNNKEVNDVIKNLIEKLKSGFNQKFIIDLLEILPLNEYDDILNLGVSRGNVDYYFGKKKNRLNDKINDNDIEKQKKVFYLLRYLEINKLFHIPKDLLKMSPLIDENTDDNLDNNEFNL